MNAHTPRLKGSGSVDWSNPRVPDAADCVLRDVLERRAAQAPEQTFALFDDGTTWSLRQTFEAANSVASALQRAGVRHGDRVLSWLPNGPDALRVWFGINLLGAIYVPLNTAYRGGLLEHAVRLADARILVAHPDLVDRLGDVALPDALQVVQFTQQTWRDPAPRVQPDQPVQPWDPYAVILTSGTTGPSKGVVCSYTHIATTATACLTGTFGPGDRYMINLPLFHAGGTNLTYAALLLGGSIALVERFDTTTFWDSIRRTRTTHVTLLGVMATFLSKQPASPADRDHPLRHAFLVPAGDTAPEFAQRFGIDVQAMFNMTEVSVPTLSEMNPTTPGTCGRLRPGVQGRLVDEHDREVTDGEVGELVLRTDRPWAMNSGYWAMPEATARAWRNGWFHTGDAFRRDGNGEFFFVDRMKDAIRRRGENISSFEVETEVLAHPAVRECAAVAVSSEDGEDEVLAVVAPAEGASIEPAELIEFLRDRLAHFMVPRYIRVVDELPKTPTSKVEKHLLRAHGVDADTWDREAAGVSRSRTPAGR
jgi:crotonobetaine/carnitine-CoA ligase